MPSGQAGAVAEAGRHAPSLPPGLGCVSAGFRLLTWVAGVWIPAFAGMTVWLGYLRVCGGGKIIFRSFPVISGNGVFLRQAQDDRMDVPPLAGVMAAWAASSSEWGLPAQYRIGCAMTAMIAAQVLRTDYGASRFWADFWTFFRFCLNQDWAVPLPSFPRRRESKPRRSTPRLSAMRLPVLRGSLSARVDRGLDSRLRGNDG